MKLIISESLRRLGITSESRGYDRTRTAISLAVEREERLHAVGKEIYLVTADRCGCSPDAVERSVRLSAEKAWKRNPDLLISMAGYPVDKRPTAKQFMEILTVYTIKAISNGKKTG